MYILSRTVSELPRRIGQIAVFVGITSKTPSFGMTPKLCTAKFGLKNVLYRVAYNTSRYIGPFISVCHQCDRQTDGQNYALLQSRTPHHAAQTSISLVACQLAKTRQDNGEKRMQAQVPLYPYPCNTLN